MQNQTQKGCGASVLGFIAVVLVLMGPRITRLSDALSRNGQMNAAVEKFVEGPSAKQVQISRAGASGVSIPNQPMAIQVHFIGVGSPIECFSWNPQIRDSALADMTRLTTGKQIKIEFDAQRTQNGSNWPDVLAYVWADEVLLNEEMIRLGYQFFTDVGQNTKYKERLLQAHAEAKSKQLGIWGVEHCPPP